MYLPCEGLVPIFALLALGCLLALHLPLQTQPARTAVAVLGLMLVLLGVIFSLVCQ